jgi:L-ascorbate metabolism protein UlaG (beta-lactamase superfamily)
MATKKGSLTWLGHATFFIETPGGKKVVIDPWVTTNPSTPHEWQKLERFSGVDLILVTHGHGDHLGDVVSIAKAHNPTVVAMVETAIYLANQGVGKATGMNKGGSTTLEGITITVTDARHSSGIQDGENLLYGGEPCGFILTLENGTRIYHAGDTCVFGDMALIRELYHPTIALLPIGDYYTMGPLEAAKAVELLSPKIVVPMHYGTFPLLTGTPEKLADLIRHLPVQLVPLKPGESLPL